MNGAYTCVCLRYRSKLRKQCHQVLQCQDRLNQILQHQHRLDLIVDQH